MILNITTFTIFALITFRATFIVISKFYPVDSNKYYISFTLCIFVSIAWHANRKLFVSYYLLSQPHFSKRLVNVRA